MEVRKSLKPPTIQALRKRCPLSIRVYAPSCAFSQGPGHTSDTPYAAVGPEHRAVTSRRTGTPRTGTSADRALGVTLIESLYIVFILPLPLLLALILDEEHSAFEILRL